MVPEPWIPLCMRRQIRTLGYESVIMTYPINYGIAGIIAFLSLYYLAYYKMNFPKKTSFSFYFNAILFGHIVFILLTGEMDTFRIFWFISSLLFVGHKNEFYQLRQN